jgi:hypothetical protein
VLPLTTSRMDQKIWSLPERAMGVAMPFSKLKLLDPEQMEALHEAFRRVCDILQIDCGSDDKLTELVVLKIVELAKSGERNPEVLCIDTIAALEGSSDGALQRPPPDSDRIAALTEPH